MRDARADEKRENKKKGETRTGPVFLCPLRGARLKLSLSTYGDGPSSLSFRSSPSKSRPSPPPLGREAFRGPLSPPWLPLESPKEHNAVVRFLSPKKEHACACTLSISRALSQDTLCLSALASRPSPSVVEHGAREVISKKEGAETQRTVSTNPRCPPPFTL